MGQMETPHRDTWEIQYNHALSIRHQPPTTITQASQELEITEGCPPTWVMRSNLRIFVSPPPFTNIVQGFYGGYRAQYEDYIHHLNSLIVIWEARMQSHLGNPIEIPMIREFPLYEHPSKICTLGHFPPIRRAFFFH